MAIDAGPNPDAFFRVLAGIPDSRDASVDLAQVIPGVTAYAVRSFDGDTIQFSVPVIIRRPLLSEIALDPRGSSGAVAAIIERIKLKAHDDPGLGPLAARGTRFPARFCAMHEPYTLTGSPDALASDLWHANTRNIADASGIHLILPGAVPGEAKTAGDSSLPQSFPETLSRYLDSVARIARSVPVRTLEDAWLLSLDQQMLREQLPDLGLVAFIGDGAKPARACTQYRSFYRTAGPKPGTNIPFACPKELSPVELELPASNQTITGLGIRKREVFAVAGSNAQGKTTFLEAVLAGVDDHARGDGREHVVTVKGVRTAEAMNCELAGADISMFFSALPPGIDGTVTAAYGMGSGSMTMAHQVQQAITKKAPLLIIDEDRAAPNLLVKSCLQKEEITPLAQILSADRGRMGSTGLLFAACAMDMLIAEADRIMVLDRHVASGIDPVEFRKNVAAMMRQTAGRLERHKDIV